MGNIRKLALPAVSWLRAYGFGLALFIVIVFGVLSGINSTEHVSREEKKEMLENNLRRAIIACYTLEGSYPMSLDYLTEHYNIVYDESEYVVRYSIFGSNIFPDYDVLEI